MKFKIKQTKRKIKGGYIGMNFYAAKSHHIPFPYPKKEVLIYEHQGKKTKLHTLHHEEIETWLMKHGLNYHKAHVIALRHEDDTLNKFLHEKW